MGVYADRWARGICRDYFLFYRLYYQKVNILGYCIVFLDRNHIKYDYNVMMINSQVTVTIVSSACRKAVLLGHVL